MNSRLTASSKTAVTLAAIGADMDRIAAATPLGPWREPATRNYATPDEMKLRILKLIDRLNAHNAPFCLKDAAE
jgi:hypothetical protein